MLWEERRPTGADRLLKLLNFFAIYWESAVRFHYFLGAITLLA
jgi:hypothetical protein